MLYSVSTVGIPQCGSFLVVRALTSDQIKIKLIGLQKIITVLLMADAAGLRAIH